MKQIYVCKNLRELSGQASCAARGSLALVPLLETGIKERNLHYQVKTSVCFGHCEKGPNIKVSGAPVQHYCDPVSVKKLLDRLA